MAALAKEVFKSKPFTFLVGEARTPFTIHTDAISAQSHALDVLVNGSMAEAQKGTAVMEDVSEDTFIRVCQFVYDGDYEPHEYILEPGSEPEPEREPEPEPEPKSSRSAKSSNFLEEIINLPPNTASSSTNSMTSMQSRPMTASKPRKSSKSRILKLLFDIKRFEIEVPITEFLQRCQVRNNEKSTENYTPVLLGHAQVYVFAEKWGIAALKNLSLYKLHQTLVDFKLYESRRDDIVKLARYAYSEENTPDTLDTLDHLRELVIHYVTCAVESLNEAPEFKLLLEENGVFGRDLVETMMDRID